MKKCAKVGLFVPCIMHSFSPSSQNISEEKKDVSRERLVRPWKRKAVSKEKKKEKNETI